MGQGVSKNCSPSHSAMVFLRSKNMLVLVKFMNCSRHGSFIVTVVITITVIVTVTVTDILIAIAIIVIITVTTLGPVTLATVTVAVEY